jgi:hypothetical protein
MKILIKALVGLALVSSAARADLTIDALGAAASITGSESVPIFQTANPAVKTTPSAIKTYLDAATHTLSAANNFTSTFQIGGVTETFPGSGLLVGTTDTQTLTNKTISTALNTITKGTNAAFGIVEGDGQTSCITAGVSSACSPIRSAASPTVATTDMGGTVIVSSGGITFPVISAGLFDNKQTLLVINYGGSAAAVTNSTGQTINSGGGCVVASGIPAGGAWQMQPNGSSIDCQKVISAAPVTPLSTTGTTATLVAPRAYEVCTTTCTITVPVPAAGYEFCILNSDNVSTVITLAALGASARYENTARTAYGTAGTGTFVSGGAVGDKVCIVGLDATHYLTTSFTGSWTAN